MPRRPKDSRKGSPIVIDLKTQDDDDIEFDDMSRRTSSKDPEAAGEVPDRSSPIFIEMKMPEDEPVEFEDLPKPIRRKVPARSGMRERPPPTVVETKPSEDSGFEFHDISYTTPAGKVLIQDISGRVGKGEMLAIMVCLLLAFRYFS